MQIKNPNQEYTVIQNFMYKVYSRNDGPSKMFPSKLKLPIFV